ncbi:metal-dependent hydrolase [bacterium]|nr:metal-dependent hydrolase [bacterium]
MPGYRGHLVGGAVAGAALFYFLRFYATPVLTIVWFFSVFAGSLFPDIDTKSKGQKWFYRLMIPALILLLIFKKFTLFVFFSFIVLAPLVVNHRGLFHRLWFILLIPITFVGLAFYYFPIYFNDVFYAALFFSVGAISHLILDYGFIRTFKFRW